MLFTSEWDSVATCRTSSADEPSARFVFAHLFYRIINRVSDAEIVDGTRSFRLVTRQTVDAVLSMAERNRFTKEIYSRVGFETKWAEF